MSRVLYKYKNENTFICEKCGVTVSTINCGTAHRNHCPECLWSKHVDLRTGDRMSVCRGLMEPISLWIKDDGEISIIHRCSKCGFIRHNRIANDDSYNKLSFIARRSMNFLTSPEVSDSKQFRHGGNK